MNFFEELKKRTKKGIGMIKKYQAEAPQRQQASLTRLDKQLAFEEKQIELIKKKKKLKELKSRKFGFGGNF